MSTEEASLGGSAGQISVGMAGDEGGAWSDLAPHPVRRWVARSFDSYVTTGFVFAIVATPWAVFGSGEARFVPFGILGLVYLLSPLRGLVTAALNAAMLSRMSITPGKWLCGIRIVRKDGAPMTFGLAFKRELDALAAGCAVYIPLIELFAMGANFFELRKNGATSWDRGRDLLAVQRANNAGQLILAFAAFLVTSALMVAVFAAGQAVWGGRR